MQPLEKMRKGGKQREREREGVVGREAYMTLQTLVQVRRFLRG